MILRAALAPLKHALELDSGLAPAHQLLGYALLAQGYAAEAIPHLDRAHEQAALGHCASPDGPVRRGDHEPAGRTAKAAE